MFDGNPTRRLGVYQGTALLTEVASERWQVHAYHQLRRRVFVAEQRLFVGSDTDEVDGQAFPIVAMTMSHGMADQVVGTVRIFRKPGDARGVWYGGRLAVDPAYRRHGSIGDALIRAAVCSAHALGCTRFLATVQLPIVRYFERHHFDVVGPTVVCGIEHALMHADLSHYPPRFYGDAERARDALGVHAQGELSQTTEAA